MQEPDFMSRLDTLDLAQQTIPVDGEKGKKETQARRNAQLSDELLNVLYDGCDTLQASFNNALKENNDRNCIGIRENKGNSYGKYQWINYRRFGTRVDHFGTGLKNTLGMKVGDKIAVMADNCIEYLIAMQAAFNQGFVLVPIYPSFGADDVSAILLSSKAEVVVVGPECAKLLSSIADGMEKLKHVVTILKHGGPGKLARGRERSPM